MRPAAHLFSSLPLSVGATLLQALLLLHVSNHHNGVVQAVSIGPAVDFRREDAMPASNLVDLKFVSRFMVPYGPDFLQRDPPQRNDEHPYAGYGFGMGAVEELDYDYENKYIYAGSDQGYIIIIDYQDPRHPIVTPYSFNHTVESLALCVEQQWLIVTDSEDIRFYQTVQRSAPATPHLLQTVVVQGKPRRILPNANCTLLVIANENSGDDLDEGSVTIIRDLNGTDGGGGPTTTFVPLDPENLWDDDYMLSKGIHMPLTQRALEYWDELSPDADELNMTMVRENYRSAIFLDPKKIAWAGPDETEVLMNCQENNGLIRVNIAQNRAVSAASYGLKDHGIVPIDINPSDRTCDMRTYDNLFSMRNPDSIATLRYNDRLYVITANEGDQKKYNGWKDGIKGEELFDNETFGLPFFEVDEEIFDPQNISKGHSALFNAACEFGLDCVGGTTLSIGSNSIDFESDPTNPIFYRMVLFGGRGWSIYELPNNPDALLKLVFDSGDAVETTGCQKYPWAHNSALDEESAPAANMTNNTLWQVADEELQEILTEMNDPEQGGCVDGGDGQPGACSFSGLQDVDSAKNGPGVEEIVVGVACGRLVTAYATEKSSVGLLFDITEITAPDLRRIFHLSPANELKNPGVAYNDGTIGDIDPENAIFLPDDKSPTGRAGIMFSGAHSGTISWWEFECVRYGDDAKLSKAQQPSSDDVSGGMSSTMSSSSWVLSSLAIVGLVAGSGAGMGFL